MTSEARVTLAIDAMGSDEGPEEILEGLALAVEDAPRSAVPSKHLRADGHTRPAAA